MIPPWAQRKANGEYQVDFSFDSMQFNLDVIKRKQKKKNRFLSLLVIVLKRVIQIYANHFPLNELRRIALSLLTQSRQRKF